MSEAVAQPMTIEEFLRARLDEDEAIAQEAINQRVAEVNAGRYNPGQEPTEQRFVAVWDDWIGGPGIRMGAERLLADIAAKRRIVARHDNCDDTSFGEPCDDLCHLASIYADHPDYQQEWRA